MGLQISGSGDDGNNGNGSDDGNNGNGGGGHNLQGNCCISSSLCNHCVYSHKGRHQFLRHCSSENKHKARRGLGYKYKLTSNFPWCLYENIGQLIFQ